jgi:hypothetical protein
MTLHQQPSSNQSVRAVKFLEELMNMPNRSLSLGVAVVSLLGALCLAAPGIAQDDSLAAQARQARKNKPTTQTRTFDNDNLPTEDKLSVVGTPQAPPSQAGVNVSDASASDATKAPNTGAPADKNAAPKTEAAKQQAEWTTWKERIVAQKEAIDHAQSDLDLLDREYRVHMAEYYSDVTNRLYNGGQWDKKDADYKAQIETKKKAVDDAKQKLEDMQEQARKAGVPASMREP